MSIEPIKAEVRGLLAQANERVRRAERRFMGGALEDRVRAAGELVALKRRKSELERQLVELNRSPDDASHTVIEWFKEDWRILLHRLDDFICARR